MSNFNVKTERSCCCCCSNEQNLYSMIQPRNSDGKREIYIDMIAKCFQLQMSIEIEEIFKNLLMICELCVLRLRDAFLFRNQVEKSYDRLTDVFNRQTGVVEKSFIELKFPNISIKYEQHSENEINVGHSLTVDVNKDTTVCNENNQCLNTFPNLEPVNSKNMYDSYNKICMIPKIRYKNYMKFCNNNMQNLNTTETKNTTLETVTPLKPIENDFNCKICNQTFYSNRTLIFHMSTHFSNFVCHICKSSFTLKTALLRHERRHEERQMLVICDICNKTFNGKNSLRRHLETHYVDCGRYNCPQCAEKFPTCYKRRMHLASVHNKSTQIKRRRKKSEQKLPFQLDKNDLTCKICNKTFVWHRSLKSHMAVHFPNYVCHICSKTFAIRRNLSLHVRRHELNKTLHTCDVCNKTFKGKDNLRGHMKTHFSDPARYKCPHCNERFPDFDKRNIHMTKVHNDAQGKYQCQHCLKYFRRVSGLNAHIKSSHLKLKRYSCELCDKSFYLKNQCKKHMIVHTGVKDFHCSICNKSYGRKTTLTEHMKIHNNIKNFTCDICDRAFTQKCTLKSHKKIHIKA